ncbi:uncharacterized protein LOC135683415 isoform X2 [Rhopilema esculentum]|uniref:uncharacterized protein LOC135683415 isoform X2 n=1 Tax=Rhopilema esculentum TaxID=499914 RepID=UPI0031DF2B0C
MLSKALRSFSATVSSKGVSATRVFFSMQHSVCRSRDFSAGAQEQVCFQSYDMPKENDLYQPWRIHKLVKKSDVIQAQALIYDVYVREMGWMFAKNNPTGFRIEKSDCGKSLLTDDLEDHSNWFGVFEEDRVVAVARRVHRNAQGHLDLTRYESSKKPQIARAVCPVNNEYVYEIQRCAIAKEYRGTNVIMCVFHYLFLNAAMNNFSIVGTSPVGKMKSFLLSTLRLRAIDHNFLYSENLEGPSTVFHLTVEEGLRASDILEEKILKRRQRQPRARDTLRQQQC